MKLKTLIPILIIAIMISCKNEKQESTETTPAATEQASPEASENQGQASVTDKVSDANALQVAQSLPDFSTLVTAIEAAGLENSVVNAGPLTIFAPTNEAFGKLPEGTVETLVKPENKEKLAFILKNHVAPANYPDTQLEKEAKKGRKLYMASGEYLEVVKKDDGLYVGGTKILKTVKVSNGWIHVIGDVIVPKDK
ncbi:fasciclin domain-containing protein [Aureibaculum algae]|uniref:Fasciclin domain-containing protein n=1 Tax=Aureibaculum algae TaxID=2584122 RepID=A0A5B7TRM5_9FLAO|nr:fasciclin domain-containing protein [Aureibaculum algae]QCX39395.1 fasciclin domain-containing protein [Aureibaculum algae]